MCVIDARVVPFFIKSLCWPSIVVVSSNRLCQHAEVSPVFSDIVFVTVRMGGSVGRRQLQLQLSIHHSNGHGPAGKRKVATLITSIVGQGPGQHRQLCTEVEISVHLRTV